MTTMVTLWGIISVCLYLLTLALLPSVILNKRKPAVSMLAWILAIILVPYLGGLLYWVFGINRVKRKVARQESTSRLGRQLPMVSEHLLISPREQPEQVQSLIRLAGQLTTMRATIGNRIEISPNTEEIFTWIKEAIRNAQETIHLEYYIWRPDATGLALRDLLIERARAGVRVRFLYDGLGSFGLGSQFFRPMLAAGIQIASFLPGRHWWERWSINLRSHRKIIVVDGHLGFTGGMNIGDEYLGKNRNFGYWRDTHLRMRGATVLQLQQTFVEDWYFATGEALTSHRLFPEPLEPGDQVAQLIAGGPDSDNDVFHTLFFAAINAAQSRITLATSYFLPTPAITTALETAAQRGVDVRLILAGKSAHLGVLLAGRSYYESLLKSGVNIFEYREGLLHAKTLTIDGCWSLVGTPNLDPRSLFLNFEVAVALYDRRLATQLEEHFQNDLKQSVPITLIEWQQRSTVRVLAENICRLFSAVL